MIIDSKTYDIFMTRGDTETITVKKKNDTFVTGETVEFNVKKFPENPTRLIHITVTSFTEDGSAIISIPHDLTKDLAFGDYCYEIKMIDTSGNIKTIVPTEDPHRRIRQFVLLKES